MINLWAMRAFAGALLASLLVFGGCRWQARMDAGAIAKANARAEQVIAEYHAAELAASERARKAEQDLARAVNAAAEEYERGKQDAQAAGERIAADLRAGNLRLQDRWRGCEARRVSAIAGSPGEPDAAADDRAESAGRIVAAADQCDAQVKGLQDFIRSERQEGIVK